MRDGQKYAIEPYHPNIHKRSVTSPNRAHIITKRNSPTETDSDYICELSAHVSGQHGDRISIPFLTISVT